MERFVKKIDEISRVSNLKWSKIEPKLEKSTLIQETASHSCLATKRTRLCTVEIHLKCVCNDIIAHAIHGN